MLLKESSLKINVEVLQTFIVGILNIKARFLLNRKICLICCLSNAADIRGQKK